MSNKESRFEVLLFSGFDDCGTRVYCKSLAHALYQAHTFCDSNPSKCASADIQYHGALAHYSEVTYVQGFGLCDFYHMTQATEDRIFA